MNNDKIKYRGGLLLFAIAVFISPLLKAQSDKALVRDGNKEFTKGKYNEAEIKYRKALDKNPQKYSAQFNLGDALYQQQNYDKAAETFSKTNVKGSTAVDRSNVYYNLGNSMLKAGKVDESIAAYKQALRENPKNEDARYNLEYARQRKQNQKNKDKKNDKNKDQNKDKKDQNKDQKDQQKQDQDKQKKDKDKQNQDQKKQQDQQQQQQQQKDSKQNQQGQQNQQQAQKISKKDAERMLAALKNNEKKTLEKLKKAKKANTKVVKSEKDW